MSEHPASPESEFLFSTEELEIIEGLKEHGIKDAETMGRFVDWVAEQEASADAAGIPRANIECNLRIGRLQLAAGFTEAAHDTFQAVLLMAHQEGEVDLLTQAEKLLDQVAARG
jgi:hypothetical protein